MAQKFDYPKSESELRETLDNLYAAAKTAVEQNESPSFKGLLEIISADATILTAIHKIKANKGSETVGSDGESMRIKILEKDFPEVMDRVKSGLAYYKSEPVRRVYIPKPGKAEKRPLGIPTIIDRIIQECVRMVIEPILEAQFFKHSYGFRPMRDAHMAIGRVTNVLHNTGYKWIVEGDISKFFDNVNHSTLLKKLWHFGLRDQRVLMIIKTMLKAGIMNEIMTNPVGTPQGGIISPLLANAYLHTLDKMVVREWEEKKTRHAYSHRHKVRALRNNSNLKPAYFVRYADDWVLITDTKSNAEKWKRRISKFLGTNLKLILSEEKTLITNIQKKPIQFVGFNYKVINEGHGKGIPRIRANPDRLREKMKQVHMQIKRLRTLRMKDNGRFHEQLIHEINLINSKIRGIIQYYQTATWVNIDFKRYNKVLKHAGIKSLRRYGGIFIPAKECTNLLSVHAEYTTKIPALSYKEHVVGITSVGFSHWIRSPFKDQDETPYSSDGRHRYLKRTGKKSTAVRADELLSLSLSDLLSKNLTSDLYNFEYFLNRPYAFNRDKGKCRVCNEPLEAVNVHTHHIDNKLPMDKVNRISNLASVHKGCHKMIHSKESYEHISKPVWIKIIDFRERLG